MKSKVKLALNGGTPIRHKPWPTYENGTGAFSDESKSELIEVLESGRLCRYDTRSITETKAGSLELSLSEYFNSRYALALSSGTAMSFKII